MHEISLVKNIFSSLDSVYSKEEQERIHCIHLTVGLLSNVEPILMNNAFEAVTATERTEYKNCKLEIQLLPILVHCSDCNADSEIKNYTFVCKLCQKPNNNVIQGNELLIAGVEFDESD